MNSSAATMELSVSFLSWINEQLRDQLQVQAVAVQRETQRLTAIRSIIVTGVATVSVAVGALIAW